jgi:hypothetical protein
MYRSILIQIRQKYLDTEYCCTIHCTMYSKALHAKHCTLVHFKSSAYVLLKVFFIHLQDIPIHIKALPTEKLV